MPKNNLDEYRAWHFYFFQKNAMRSQKMSSLHFLARKCQVGKHEQEQTLFKRSAARFDKFLIV